MLPQQKATPIAGRNLGCVVEQAQNIIEIDRRICPETCIEFD